MRFSKEEFVFVLSFAIMCAEKSGHNYLCEHLKDILSKNLNRINNPIFIDEYELKDV